MAIEAVRRYFAAWDMSNRVQELECSSATVDLAAAAVGVEPARIAKTLSFQRDGGSGCLLVLTAGDQKIDNAKFKAFFGMKAKMLPPDQVAELTGHEVGGVCPFAIDPSIPVYLDRSMQRFDTVFPACGSANSAIELSCEELFECANALAWVDVSKAAG